MQETAEQVTPVHPTLASFVGDIRMSGRTWRLQSRRPVWAVLRISSPRAAKPEDFPAAISMSASSSVRLEPLVTDRFPLDAIADAFAAAQEATALKVVVEF
jgi:threonine dehydrogenase-like Zn-dependent dehydrogenase